MIEVAFSKFKESLVRLAKFEQIPSEEFANELLWLESRQKRIDLTRNYVHQEVMIRELEHLTVLIEARLKQTQTHAISTEEVFGEEEEFA